MDLSTRYLGLQLRNPLLASASPLSQEDHDKEKPETGRSTSDIRTARARHVLFRQRSLPSCRSAQSRTTECASTR